MPAEVIPSAGQSVRELPRLRILVVEDDADARDMLRTFLQLAGHEVYEAADGFDALQVAGQVKPHLVLIDIGLPGLDGLEVAARLRAMADGDRVVLVAVTGYGQTEDRRKTADAGFDLHLTKPVDPELVKEIVGTFGPALP